MKKTKQKKSRLGQYDAKYFMTGLNISEPLHFASLHRYVFYDHQKIFLTLYRPRSLEDQKSRTRTVSQPRPFYLTSVSSPLQSEIIDNSLRLAQPRPNEGGSANKPFYSGSARGSICTVSKNVAFDIFKNLKEEAQSIVLKISSDEFLRTFCGKKYEPRHGLSGIKAKHSGMEDKRNLIINIASAELGVHETTGNNDGPRVEEYLRYTNLGKGYEWCAAFVSWCYGQAGLEVPRNPWSPALFPKARQIAKDKARPADVFGIYGAKAKRINHVGLVKEHHDDYLITIEGNSNDRVESRRRHLRTVYAVAEWVK
ncbi:CHAP domain-containing protein [Sphingobacterium yanglingense]|nr:CHAP domain-containing protein [Sphingobacterium yanglingense]